MMRSTQTRLFSVKQVPIRSALHYNNVCEQPYYLKPVRENPYFGTVHDGISTEYQQGFSVKPIHHLYRFTHNYLPLNIPRNGLHSPSSKRLHWLEMTSAYKIKSDYCTFEAIPPLSLICFIIGITTWHVMRVCFYHPDITWYNLAFPTNKNFVQFIRFNQKHQLDQPVYRFLQQQTEFYFKDASKRELIALDWIVNDPYINHVKEIGRGEELLVHSYYDKGKSSTGNLQPSVFYEKSSWWTPTEERWKSEPEKAFAQHAGSNTFWSLYTNLYRI